MFKSDTTVLVRYNSATRYNYRKLDKNLKLKSKILEKKMAQNLRDSVILIVIVAPVSTIDVLRIRNGLVKIQ